MSTTRPGTGIAKTAGLLSLIAGIIFVLAGGVTWFVVSDQLAAEEITVPEDANFLAGREVGGPFTAYAQADIINQHALAGTDGRTYAELGAAMREVEEGSPEHEELQAQRDSVMNASFLRASLFTSVVAYGVAALVIGLGVLLGLVGLALMNLAKAAQTPVYADAPRDYDAGRDTRQS
ncbi:aromatic ring-opening dioxygenase LigA [Georgenia wangjunii]|uniref:aromatic ring-opening dioxygenase LigA n=1 Tax=Georgenia wangjunii TaxID=3117730 RepID=UPI002F2605E5